MKLEDIKVASIEDLETRTKEIRGLDIDKVDNADELLKEIEAIEARKKELRDAEDAKKELRNKINQGAVKVTPIEKPEERGNTMKLTQENYLSSAEYRSAYLKNLLEKPLNTEERAALAMAGAKPAIPDVTQNAIIKKVKEYANVLADITLLHVNGNVKFAVEKTVAAADIHTENATITAAADALVEVALSTYEVVKLIQISASVKSMSIDAFETWLVDTLAQAIAMKVEELVFNGTGSSQPKGINGITWTKEKNSIEVAKASKPTAQNVFDLVGLFKEKDGKFYMNRKTLFSEYLPLQDKAKNDLVNFVNGTYYILGFAVELTNSMKDSEVLLGNMKKYVANLSQDVTMHEQYDIDTNSYKYNGCVNFDGKPAYDEAFVKMTKASV